MINKKIYVLLPLILMIVGLSACAAENSEDISDETLSIVTSFYPVYEFAQQVAGEHADISLMVDGGSDPHSYEPSARDIAGINNADLFIYTSEEMEFWVPSLLNTIENEELEVVRTADGLGTESHYDSPASNGNETDLSAASVTELPEEVQLLGLAGHYHSGDTVTLLAQYEQAEDWEWYVSETEGEWEQIDNLTSDRFEYQIEQEDILVQAVATDGNGNELAQSEVAHVHIDDHEEEDPHIWLDPVLAQDQVLLIMEALIEADPANAENYQENADQFINELSALHEDYLEAFEDAENRTFVVQHQAFGYIASRYDLDQIAIGGLSTEVEPSPSRIAEINQLVNEHDVPVIYYQQGANSAIAQTVANETGTETAVLHDLETLSDELQAEGLGYVEAMRENLEALKQSIN
ncbi:metal ABC transporter solute-binding protein, Zn/Mn family [Alkalibacterium pelagium]|uniref:Zinc transport system substrate-binding protein n=1 Tax=Alkalibacterium pelagium TaxID=426702 RepID=A0A1H7NYF5_9LACT|nr:zinc ABC transporter substrate-binding protein [Alkalibacterium pelagium]GEN51483.1 hypothetical protein APE02nite_21480 [Alkalibacterium pelagium]SEL27887.1 zinc transport system substrate-binding protein [Alkalibacterium pelagium]